MSNYEQYNDYSDKDNLDVSDPERIILGSDLDEELLRISTAITSKIDKPAGPTEGQVLTYTSGTWEAGDASSVSIPAATILPYAGPSAPAGYLLCDGSAVSQTTYAALWSALGGHVFGSDPGGGNFYLPDLRFRVPIGSDDMTSSAGRDAGVSYSYGSGAVGSAGGTATKTLTSSQIPAHAHAAGSLTAPAHNHQASIGVADNNDSSGESTTIMGSTGSPNTTLTNYITTGGASSSTVTGSTANNAGGGSAHEVMNPFVAINYIIKV